MDHSDIKIYSRGIYSTPQSYTASKDWPGLHLDPRLFNTGCDCASEK